MSAQLTSFTVAMVRLFQTEIHLPPDSSVCVEPLERRAFSWNRMRRSISSSSHQMYPKSGSQTRLHGDSFRSDARIVAIRCCTVHEPKLLVKIFKIFNAIACARPPGPLGRGRARDRARNRSASPGRRACIRNQTRRAGALFLRIVIGQIRFHPPPSRGRSFRSDGFLFCIRSIRKQFPLFLKMR